MEKVCPDALHTLPFRQLQLHEPLLDSFIASPPSLCLTVSLTLIGVVCDRTSTYMRYRCSLELLNSMHFCQGLSDSDLWKIGKACQLASYSKDQYIVREGAEGVNLFVLCKGQAVATTKIGSAERRADLLAQNKEGDSEPILLKEYQEGEHFGEIAAFTQEPRKADVRATTFVESILINRRVFSTLPQVVLDRLSEPMSSYRIYHLVHPKTGLLRMLPRFELLTPMARWSVAKLCEERNFEDGDVLCHQVRSL